MPKQYSSFLIYKKIGSPSFDDNNTDPFVLATATNNGQCLLERLFFTNHVSAVNSSTNTSMSSNKSPKTNLSNAVPKARPFDEFFTGITSTSTNPLDGQSFGATKSDKD